MCRDIVRRNRSWVQAGDHLYTKANSQKQKPKGKACDARRGCRCLVFRQGKGKDKVEVESPSKRALGGGGLAHRGRAA